MRQSPPWVLVVQILLTGTGLWALLSCSRCIEVSLRVVTCLFFSLAGGLGLGLRWQHVKAGLQNGQAAKARPASSRALRLQSSSPSRQSSSASDASFAGSSALDLEICPVSASDAKALAQLHCQCSVRAIKCIDQGNGGALAGYALYELREKHTKVCHQRKCGKIDIVISPGYCSTAARRRLQRALKADVESGLPIRT
mmetsp:Transcript_34592/g.109504  ORF Transcript_34592/g.109504 Transcript_34592/m.109504 type:complete len:198 (+) Transcript_34592:191-784(+)